MTKYSWWIPFPFLLKVYWRGKHIFCGLIKASSNKLLGLKWKILRKINFWCKKRIILQLGERIWLSNVWNYSGKLTLRGKTRFKLVNYRVMPHLYGHINILAGDNAFSFPVNVFPSPHPYIKWIFQEAH